MSSDDLDLMESKQLEIDGIDSEIMEDYAIPNGRPMRRFIDLGGVTSALTGLLGLGNLVGNVVGNAVGKAVGGVVGMGSGALGMNGGFSFGGNFGGNAVGNAGGSFDGNAAGNAAGNAGGNFGQNAAGGNDGGYSSGVSFSPSNLGSGQYQTNNIAMGTSSGPGQFGNPNMDGTNPTFSQLPPVTDRFSGDPFVASGIGGGQNGGYNGGSVMNPNGPPNVRYNDPNRSALNYPQYEPANIRNTNSFVPPPPPPASNEQSNTRRDITIGSDGTSYSATGGSNYADVDRTPSYDGQSQYGIAIGGNRNEQSRIRQDASGYGNNRNGQSNIRQSISPRSQRKRMRTNTLRRAGSDQNVALEQSKPIETPANINVNNEWKNESVSGPCGRLNRFDVTGTMERRLKGIQLMEDFIRTFKLMLLTLLD